MTPRSVVTTNQFSTKFTIVWIDRSLFFTVRCTWKSWGIFFNNKPTKNYNVKPWKFSTDVCVTKTQQKAKFILLLISSMEEKIRIYFFVSLLDRFVFAAHRSVVSDHWKVFDQRTRTKGTFHHQTFGETISWKKSSRIFFGKSSLFGRTLRHYESLFARRITEFYAARHRNFS